ncbi:MAG: electron transfer flavoprotein subunit beta/FixA family protein [Prevotellaceae bacterium]|jgi:electron transfer flavoprotein beta subunit|nr:electron transfer flavoprotein subunit beta/FixA family protein [Prevotellaceae bacterium]
MKIAVLAKQVPDTRNVGKDAMKDDGTVNRAALPAIFNPEDLHALEAALRLKEQTPETEIVLLTMGPVRAADILREGLFRGADGGVLLTDRKFAGADTLATSYAIARAMEKLNPDLIIAGRQAIDGDTAQVGPQVAEKLGMAQITYAEEIVACNGAEITVKRRLEHGVETVKGRLPLLVTVNASAPSCRPRNIRQTLKFKHAKTKSEIKALEEQAEKSQAAEDQEYLDFLHSRPFLNFSEWSADDIGGEETRFGLKGSPTKVKKIENVVFTAKESKRLSDSDADIEALVAELAANHTLG